MRFNNKVSKKILSFAIAGVLVLSCILSGCGVYKTGSAAYETGADTGEVITDYDDSEFTDFDPNEFFENADPDAGIFDVLDAAIRERLTEDYITPSEYSRPGDALETVEGIVVHYLGNPGTTAQENRDYFDSLAYSGEEYASCHFVIGLEGEIIQLIPTSEIAYCSNDANDYTISIECCHPDDTGVFTNETYSSLVLLCAWLCEQYGLTYQNIIRHYDVTGKLCPLAFVENPDYFYGFLANVAISMGNDITAEEAASLTDFEFDLNASTELDSYETDHSRGWRPDSGRHGGPP